MSEKQRRILVVFSNAVDGRDRELNEWYFMEHHIDVLAVPGYFSVERFRLDDTFLGEAPPWRYVSIYEAEGEVAELVAATNAAAEAGRMTFTDAIADDHVSWTAVPIEGQSRPAKPETPAAERRIVLVFTNAVDGQDAELNEWYLGEHHPEVLSLGHVETAERFRLDETWRGETPPWRYLSLYEAHGSLENMVGRIVAAQQAGGMRLTEHMADDHVTWTATPLTEA